MKQLPNLDAFAKILIDKGFNVFFQTQVAYPGRLKESITEFMEACNNGKESDRDGNFLLSTYLQWSGDDNSSIVCDFWVRKENDGFDIQKMEITSKNRYGQLLKKAELKNLSINSIPTLKESIAEVSVFSQQKDFSQKRGFRM
ncbi:hypothetical protein B0A67_03280 [Flavobacterium aquidurense]|uniref:hypothetical protein n=1 Tax=Flavobacterium aquidurense TaxID=362413 RepID=UPI00091BAA1C|nr:hypothetical protein [Flavobacterium aquidurense]OXA73712.1 hypothetical protein B0A67_03280 [Flavobacterium aquidurense]SHG78286.1 hypothetical protein SAMN05444481_107149 [Flavobacterium frigidimaris]